MYIGFICEFDQAPGPCYIALSDGECVLLDADPALGDMSVDTDGDGFPDNNDLNPTEYDVAVEKVVGATGGAGTIIRLNTGAIWRLSGLSDLNMPKSFLLQRHATG